MILKIKIKDRDLAHLWNHHRMVPGAEHAVAEFALESARLGADAGGAVVGRRPECH